MKNSTRWFMAAVFLGFVLLGAGPAGAIEMLTADYVVEHYVSFDCANYRPVTDLAFDPAGNLYVTHSTSAGGGLNGTIYRVDTDRNVTAWVTGITRPLGITWVDGSIYGDYLYISESYGNAYWSNGGVTRISLDGTVTRFSGSGLQRPVPIAVDRTGNYGGYMYVGNGSNDNIRKLRSDGQMESFSSFPYNISGSPSGIIFDETGNYGGKMIVGVYGEPKNSWSGLFTLDINGNPTRFAPEIVSVNSMALDTSAAQRFRGHLYVIGFTDADSRWALYRVYPDGQIEQLSVARQIIYQITFGPDGNLYVVESNWNDTVATVSRISNRNPLLVPLEKAIALKEEALEKVELALTEERALLAALEELGAAGDPCALGPMDILRVKVNIALSILQERATMHHLNKSIERLQDGWKILAGEDDYGNIWKKIQKQRSDLERADLNGDGIVDTRDFAIMSRYWLQTYKR